MTSANPLLNGDGCAACYDSQTLVPTKVTAFEKTALPLGPALGYCSPNTSLPLNAWHTCYYVTCRIFAAATALSARFFRLQPKTAPARPRERSVALARIASQASHR